MAEQRYQAVLAVIGEGGAVSEVAGRWGVSRQSVHAWLARYEAGGLEGLADRSHRPASCPHQMSPVVEARVLELRRVHRSWGARRIVFELARAGVAPVPSESGVYRALVRAGLIEPGGRRRRAEHWRRWERGVPNELWQMDVVGGFLLADGSHAKALTGIDDHSRFCVCAALMARERTRPVCEALAAALDRYGVPQQILTDIQDVYVSGCVARCPAGEVWRPGDRRLPAVVADRSERASGRDFLPVDHGAGRGAAEDGVSC